MSTGNQHLDRILREAGIPDLIDVLAGRLTPTDLQSLLLEVYRRRAARLTPAALLAQQGQNRFVRPAAVDPQALLAFDQLAFAQAHPQFTPVELAPVAPLGACSALGLVDQNKAVATSRNTEVVSDSTNVLALECALRRRNLLHTPEQQNERVRLCASHRQQLAVYLRLLAALRSAGYRFLTVRVAVTDLSGGRLEVALRDAVLAPLAAAHPAVRAGFDPDRQDGRTYYTAACFHIFAGDSEGHEYQVGDGGFTDWTQGLLGSAKERLLISGLGTERLCSLFAP